MSERIAKKQGSVLKTLSCILLSACIGGAAGYGSSYLAKNLWTVQSSLEKPALTELGNYYSLYSTYQLLNNEKANQDPTGDIFNRFKQLAGSYEHAKVFWENTDYYKQKLTDDSQHDSQLLDQLSREIKLLDTNAATTQLSLELDNPKRARELLTEYIDYTGLANRKNIYGELIVKWKTLFDQVNSAANLNVADTERQKWKSMLSMMQSVKPLDDQLVSYHFIQKPGQAEISSPNRIYWAGIGSAIGAFFGLFIGLFIRRKY
ncbi:chain-length determining protein [Basfia succiniciproducens]|uniref:Lipopolysaccharide biosynthesis protein WzzE n=2 Tax=Basfia succiniciproducens TaxID=653940 RepID=A0A1G5BNH8_9PAST|nr:chain-length determining protein [Basfia succiniciproducens]QIM68312.1 chain-length determining protein [Basfia succiniciproducens]SCX91795.1 lipopolysaccharide biosynthesis protein WzzE [Basfia succiniciproducens]